MALFRDILKSDESLFRDAVALDFDYMPKVLPYREREQKYIANCIKPLFQRRNGKNLVITGPPGVGKTIACKHVLKELEDESEEISPVYINCWQKNTSHKIVVEMCDQVGYKFTQNQKTDELFKVVTKIMNKGAVVFAFDEIDKAEDYDFLYWILEDIYRKTIVLITNYRDWIAGLDDRIKSRLMPDIIAFNSYNKEETKGILKHRLEYAFVPGTIGEQEFEIIVNKTAERGDIRSGLFLLREAANAAEDAAAKKITKEHVEKAIAKLDTFTIKSSEELEDDTKDILELIKKNPDVKIGDLYRKYGEEGGKAAYKTFQRRIKKLEENKFITTQKVTGGSDGTTTIIKGAGTKKLTEF